VTVVKAAISEIHKSTLIKHSLRRDCEMFVTSKLCYINYPLVGEGLNETDNVFERQILIIIFGTSPGA
jgi:hypothetical protein